MQKKLLLVFTALGILNIFTLNAQMAFSFTDFDYPEETITWGSHTKMSYFIPVNTSQLGQRNKVHLDFKTSDVLTIKESFVTLVIGNTPIATKTPSPEDHTISFTVDFDKDDIVSGFLKIEVLNNFSITDDICEIYNEGAFWIRRLASSSITLDYDESYIKPNTISEFIPKIDKLLIPEKPSNDELNYAAYIQFYFKRKLNQTLEIATIPGSYNAKHSNSITLTEFEHLPADLKALSNRDTKALGRVELLPLGIAGDSSTIDQPREIQTLLVTGADKPGFLKAAQSLLADDILQSAYSASYTVEEGMDMSYPVFATDREVSLRELGVAEETTEGIGKLTKEITLSRSVFGSKLSELELELSFTYRPLKEQENAYVNIYLEGALKFSQALDQTGKFDESILFENLNLNKISNFRIEYYYVPAGGLCVVNPILFYAQLNLNASYFKAQSYGDDKDLDFFYFPENFTEKQPAIYLDLPYSQNQVSALSTLIEHINPNLARHRYLYPKILPVDSLKSNSDRFNPIIISSESKSIAEFSAKNTYFKLNGEQYEFEKDTYLNYFKIKYDDAIGVSQLFKKGETNAMFMYVPGGSAAILNLLIAKIDEQGFNKRGDLILASDRDAYIFNLKNTNSLVNEEEIQSGFDLFWKNYRVFIIFGLFILMIVILIYIFQKSQESKKNIVDEN